MGASTGQAFQAWTSSRSARLASLGLHLRADPPIVAPIAPAGPLRKRMLTSVGFSIRTPQDGLPAFGLCGVQTSDGRRRSPVASTPMGG